MNNGFIKLNRTLKDNWLWSEQPYSKGQAWIDMLLNTNFKQSKFMKNNRLVVVNRGELCRSEVELADRWGWSRDKVRRFIKVLTDEHMVIQQTIQGISVFTICNYEKYQSNDTADKTVGKTVDKTIDDTHIKKDKESKEVLLRNTAYGKPEINDMFNYWQEKVGYEITSRKQANRNACSNMYKKYGKDKLEQLINGVSKAQEDRYAPRIGDFVELQANLNKLLAWGKTQQTPQIKSFGGKK